MNFKSKQSRIKPPSITVREKAIKEPDLKSSNNSFKAPDKPCSPLKILTKPDQSKSEILSEVLKRRNLLEEAVSKIQKNYSKQEAEIFELINDEEEIKLLITTRPPILNPIQKSPESPVRSPQSKSFRKLLTKGSDEQNSSKTSQSSSQRVSKEKLEPLKDRLQLEFYQRRESLISDLELSFSKTLSENKQIIEDYWANRIQNLEHKYNSLSVVTEESEDFGRIEYIKDLTEILEPKIREEYKARSKYSKSIPKKEKENLILRFQAEVEIEQMDFLEEQREQWKKVDVFLVQEECKENLWLEQEDLLMRKENELRRQAEFELREIISSLMNETESALTQKSSKIIQDQEWKKKEIENLVIEECYQEMLDDEIDLFKSQIFPKLRFSLYKEIKNLIFPQIEIDLKLKLEEKICKELSQNFQKDLEAFSAKLEKEQKNKLMGLECQFETSRAEVLKKSSEERFLKIEKDLKIGFLRKLDKLKSDTRKEFEETYGEKERDFKNYVMKEKTETAQLKATINVLVNQINEVKQALFLEILESEEQFNRVARDWSIRKQYESEQSQFKSSPARSKSPMKKADLNFDQDLAEILPKPLPPPSQSFYLNDSSRMSASPKRRLLKNFNTKNIVNEIIMKGPEDLGKSQNQFYRVLDTPARPRSTIPYIPESSLDKSMSIKTTPKKKSLYSDLLRKKYGILEPRNKK